MLGVTELRRLRKAIYMPHQPYLQQTMQVRMPDNFPGITFSVKRIKRETRCGMTHGHKKNRDTIFEVFER